MMAPTFVIRPADPHQIRVIARKAAAQAEMQEQGLVDV